MGKGEEGELAGKSIFRIRPFREEWIKNCHCIILYNVDRSGGIIRRVGVNITDKQYKRQYKEPDQKIFLFHYRHQGRPVEKYGDRCECNTGILIIHKRKIEYIKWKR